MLSLNRFGHASSELDRKFQFETIGLLRSDDNVEGLFSEYTATAFNEYFARQSRFTIQPLGQADTLLSQSKIPYSKLIYDPDILNQIARSLHVETLIRTRIKKEGQRYTISLDWLHLSPTSAIETISSVSYVENVNATDSLNTDFITKSFTPYLDTLIGQVPFKGSVTGRDAQSITVNIGDKANLKKGDVLVIGTLDEVKRHPLLKTIVDWKLTETGKVEVEQADESLAFCKILEETPSKEIARYQKIIRIQDGSPTDPIAPENGSPKTPPPPPPAPTLGWVGIGFSGGSNDWQYSSLAGSASNTGGGFLLGAKAQSEIWLTQDWFANLESGYSFWTFSQKDTTTGTPSPTSQNGGVGGSMFSFKLNVAYSYLLSGDLFGPRGWIKLGYKSNSYTLPLSLTENTGPITFGSIFAGIGGDYPIRGNWGITAGFNLRLLAFISENWLNDTTHGSSDVEILAGAYYRFTPRLTFRTLLEVSGQSADFASGKSVSQKVFTITPALLYYF